MKWKTQYIAHAHILLVSQKHYLKKVLYFAHKIKTDHGAELNLKKNA